MAARCENCVFVQGGLRKDTFGDDEPYWFCRRFPPTVMPGVLHQSSFPYVNGHMWCGEHKPVEEGDGKV